MFPYYLVIPSVCALFCIFCGVICRKCIPASLHITVAEALLSVAVDTFSLFCFHIINGALHNFYCLIDFFLILFATYSLIPRKAAQMLYSVLSVLFIILWVFFVLIYKNNGINQFANYPIVGSSLLLTANYLYTLYYSESNEANIVKKIATRLLCFSMMTYLTGTFALFITIKPFLTNYKIPGWFVDINTVLDSTKYIIIGLSFYKYRQYFLKTSSQKNG